MLTTSLDDLVVAYALDPDLWRPHVRFREGERYWHRLAQTDTADLWLLTWTPSQSTDLHDHGTSSAAFTVVEGALEEVRFADGAFSRQVLQAGDVGRIGAGQIHDVRHAGSAPAVSIHAYSPRLTTMSFWQQHEDVLVRVRTVATDEPEVLA